MQRFLQEHGEVQLSALGLGKSFLLSYSALACQCLDNTKDDWTEHGLLGLQLSPQW